MTSGERSRVREASIGRWKRINTWSIKGPVLLLACIYGGLSAAFNWDAVPLVAAIAIVLPILGFRGLWKETKFWITILLLGLVQIPLVIGMRMWLHKPSVPLLIAFSIGDCFLVILLVLWTFPSE
jgi:hypothetical protein